MVFFKGFGASFAYLQEIGALSRAEQKLASLVEAVDKLIETVPSEVVRVATTEGKIVEVRCRASLFQKMGREVAKGGETVTREVTVKPLGLGSTGRTVIKNLTEQLALEEIMSNPSLGRIIKQRVKDPRWNGWCKMSNRTAHGVEIHYVAKWEDGILKMVDDFKFVGE